MVYTDIYERGMVQLPLATASVPLGQAIQVDPGRLYWFLSQSIQLMKGGTDCWPAGQLVQLSEPGSSAYLPASHGIHDLSSGNGAYRPTGQSLIHES
eukprot:COSAG02_NODE_1448_length_12570_cov_711.058295_3_plen_97_part_00